MGSSSFVDGTAVRSLPCRLFATDHYPADRRVNSYSKLQYLLDIVQILHGTSELDRILESPLGGLFKLHVHHCSMSGKLVHNIICRQLVCPDEDGVWFTFGGQPLRFSLAEFEVLTGLNCGPYPPDHIISASQTPRDVKKPYLYKLLGQSSIMTIVEIVDLLKSEPQMASWRRFRLVLLVIVEGILRCGTQPVCASIAIAEMVKDVDFFLNYPWGRESFRLTVRMLQVGSRVATTDDLVAKLKKSSVAIHGFPIALQLLFFRSIPRLLDYVPHGDDLSTFVMRPIDDMPTLKTFHMDNILLVENDPQLIVSPLLPLRDSSGGSVCMVKPVAPCMAYFKELIEQGYEFGKSDWKGGNSSEPKLCTCGRKRHCICSCVVPSSESYTAPNVSLSGDDLVARLASECANLLSILRQIKKDRKVVTEQIYCLLEKKINKLQSSVVSEVEALLGSSRSGTPFRRKFVRGSGSSYHSSPVADHGDRDSDHLSIRETDIKSHEDLSAEVHLGKREEFKRLNCNMDKKCEGVVDMNLESGLFHQRHSDRARSSVCYQEGSAGGYAKFVEGSSKLPSTFKRLTRSQTEKGKKAETTPSSSHCVQKRRGDMIDDVCVPAEPLRPTKQRKLIVLQKQRSGRRYDEKSHIVSPVADGMNGCLNSVQSTELYASTVGFCPFPRSSPAVLAKFKARLQAAGKRSVFVDGEEVRSNFLSDIVKPQQWLSNLHLDAMIATVWRDRSKFLLEAKLTITDCYFTQFLTSSFAAFKKCEPHSFAWPSSLRQYVLGHVPDRLEIAPWMRDVHTIYAPMNWELKHWVGLVINLRTWEIQILDPYISVTRPRRVPSLMAPVVEMLPHLIAAFCPTDCTIPVFHKPFTYRHVYGISQNERTGDCGALAVKFMELHSHGQPLTGITDAMVSEMRMEYALRVYAASAGPYT